MLDPRIGRTFLPEESQPAQQDVVVLSQELWARKFGSKPSVLGRPISLDNKSFVVVGVMPESFSFPNGSEYWVPLTLTSNCSRAFDLVVAHLSLDPSWLAANAAQNKKLAQDPKWQAAQAARLTKINHRHYHVKSCFNKQSGNWIDPKFNPTCSLCALLAVAA